MKTLDGVIQELEQTITPALSLMLDKVYNLSKYLDYNVTILTKGVQKNFNEYLEPYILFTDFEEFTNALAERNIELEQCTVERSLDSARYSIRIHNTEICCWRTLVEDTNEVEK